MQSEAYRLKSLLNVLVHWIFLSAPKGLLYMELLSAVVLPDIVLTKQLVVAWLYSIWATLLIECMAAFVVKSKSRWRNCIKQAGTTMEKITALCAP